MTNLQRRAAGCALAAAALYAVSVPLSKLLLERCAPTMLAALLYLGAGVGLGACALARRLRTGRGFTAPLTRRELPFTAAMVALDIAAPVLLLFGVRATSASAASLLSNFEIVATALAAFALFGEHISRRLWGAIALITAASALLSFEGRAGLVFNAGSLLVLGACACWGLENNCTRRLSDRDPVEIVLVKGLGSGLGSLCIALARAEALPAARVAAAALCLGFASYGLSICLYILAQKELGAAKTSAYYAAAPFLGAGFGAVLLRERPGGLFWAALALLVPAVWLTAREDGAPLPRPRLHPCTHTHAHRHGALVHTHAHTHLCAQAAPGARAPVHFHTHRHAH